MKEGVESDVRHEVDMKKIDPRIARLMQSANISMRQERLLDDRRRKFKNRCGLVLLGVVLSIYAYSMYAVKQEHFLSDLDQKVIEERKRNSDKQQDSSQA